MGEDRQRPPAGEGATPAPGPRQPPHAASEAVERIAKAQHRVEEILRRNEEARGKIARAAGAVRNALARGELAALLSDPAERLPGRRSSRAGLAAGRGVADPLELVLEQSCLLAGAAAGLVFELSRSEETLELVCASGMPPEAVEAWRRLSVSSEATPSEAVRRLEPVTASSWAELSARCPALASASQPIFGASVAIPLVIDGLCSGALELFFREDGAFTRDELSLLRPIARRIALCLESVALVKRDRQSRGRLYMLAEASRLFSAAGSDVSSVLGAIANQLLIGFASSCTIALLSRDGQGLEAVLIRDRDPERERRLRQMAHGVLIARGEGFTGQVLVTGRSILLSSVAPGEIGARTVPSLAPQLEALGMRSLLIAPVATSGRILGTISTSRFAGEVPFGEDDRVLLEDLGDRAAMAIENARLHEVERAARARAEEADRRKDEFLAVLSHELRNPLAPLQMGVELMRGLPPGDDGVDWAREMIARQVGQLSRLVGDLLDVSRINLGKIDLCLEAIDLSAVASAALEAIRPRLAERGHAVTVELPPNPVLVRGDAARLTQVITNLLDNGAKYTEPGGRINLSVASAAGQATVAVEDTGIGIAPEMLDRVFDPFTRLGPAREQAVGGLGIGLALVRQLVEIHHGAVRAHSEGPGRGSRFVLSFPLLARASEEPPDAGGRATEREPTPSRRILVVDDNADAAESLRRILLSQGHEVHVLHDGLAAAETVEKLEPDVVLMDIGLPGVDGLEVARRLRRCGLTRQPLLVATTGLGRHEDRIASALAGFDHHLVKPIDVAALKTLLAHQRSDASRPGEGSAAGPR